MTAALTLLGSDSAALLADDCHDNDKRWKMVGLWDVARIVTN